MSCAMSEMSRYPGFCPRAILNKSDTLHTRLATESCFWLQGKRTRRRYPRGGIPRVTPAQAPS
ncbi:hypothetical protein XAP412_730022 [Xanthomonas phaseoli pv. phaseoli]|uniref:Transposase n=1 Tax=Xanthomonas campestris pv. phaseoli TaxID=317013 RepID=A0AB38E5X7_XANCH|nr:hypothetical protein XAP6984_770021 [Xanthomonas phaseoli pv. phaseoli]SON89495.1 hypothetical protein XAP412_730022 [Xanthomonas phaseoli pv. phaseoli]SON92201.1 hypothetical protein XAP7430_730022 [Xanthomonas phaseoli pv. phaseoli]